ncbi:MAG: HAMP domain-containing histidine kinase [Clostridiales bacterium]|jgi:signal transduction histidine kinase|nr:HAMP domain-containing histidine kinase [Clostridiales bacterium]
MFKQLRNRFIILNMSMTSFIMLAAFVLVFAFTGSTIDAQNRQKLYSLRQAASAIGAGGSIVSIYESGAGLGKAATVSVTKGFAVDLDGDGNIWGNDFFGDIPKSEVELAAKKAFASDGRKIKFADRIWMYEIASNTLIFRSNLNSTGVSATIHKILFLDVTDSQQILNQLLFVMILTGLSMLAIIFFVSLLFSKKSIAPISDAWNKQRQFVADASHELKTPLHSIMANFDALSLNEDETIKSQREWLDCMAMGMDRMARLMERLLSLARLENEKVKAEKKPFDINEAIADVMDAMEAAAADRNLKTYRHFERPAIAEGNEELFVKLFEIIYDNAIKHSNEGGIIEVSVHMDKRRAIAAVKNSGPGISQKDLPYIFERFYRADASRASENGGYGLGLAIAREAASKIGCKILAESKENEWTVFSVAIPTTCGRF